MPNHISNSVAPILFTTACLLVLLTFLSPTIVFQDVSLLTFSSNSTATAAKAKRSFGLDATEAHPSRSHKMIRAPIWKRKANATSSSQTLATSTSSTSVAAATASATSAADVSSTTTTERVKISFGPMGACYSLGASKNTTCQSPSFTPIFTPIYELTSIRSDILDDLPDQFPLAPTALFLGTLLGVFAWMASILASLPFHIKSLTRLEKRRQYFTKATLYCGGVSVLFGLIASIALRLQLGNVVDAVSSRARQDTAASSITLGSGFSQLWAGWSLMLIAVLATSLALFR